MVAVRPDASRAAEIEVWTARALATVLAEAGPRFEKATGHHLAVTADLSGPFLQRARAGEPFDVLITGAAPLDELIAEGTVAAGTRTPIARSGIGVEVRAGAPKPDIGSVEGFKKALLDARSIAYLKDVGSGIHVARVIESLGLADAVRPKVTRPDRDVVSEMVARGEIELGIVVITQILTTPGVELVGPLPAEIQSYVAFVAGVGARAKERQAAKALVAFLTGPVAVPVIEAQGMEAGEGRAR